MTGRHHGLSRFDLNQLPSSLHYVLLTFLDECLKRFGVLMKRIIAKIFHLFKLWLHLALTPLFEKTKQMHKASVEYVFASEHRATFIDIILLCCS